MTTIRATCPTCGDVELKPAELRLSVCTRPEWSTYAFESHDGPRLNYDDLLDFALWLDANDALAATVQPAQRA